MLFRYLGARWKHPGASVARHIRSGLGLEERARYLGVFWSDHLSRTRAAQARWARKAKGKVVTVLGAGPLLDLNSGALATAFQKFRLVDANPLVAEGWGRLNKPVEPVITDITNCLEMWCRRVKECRGSWAETLSLMQILAAAPVPAYAVPTDGLLSLNVMSQLEIGWQEAIEPILRRRFGRRFVHQHEAEWLEAIRPGTRVLIEQHLVALDASGARDVLLITDIDYVEYKGRTYSRLKLEEPPMRWTDGAWVAEEGVTFEVVSAVEGIDLAAAFTRWMPAYKVDWHESWIWHIAPNGTETTPFGKLHRVGAFALSRDS